MATESVRLEDQVLPEDQVQPKERVGPEILIRRLQGHPHPHPVELYCAINISETYGRDVVNTFRDEDGCTSLAFKDAAIAELEIENIENILRAKNDARYERFKQYLRGMESGLTTVSAFKTGMFIPNILAGWIIFFGNHFLYFGLYMSITELVSYVFGPDTVNGLGQKELFISGLLLVFCGVVISMIFYPKNEDRDIWYTFGVINEGRLQDVRTALGNAGYTVNIIED